MNTPSVTTSMRVRFETRLVSRTRRPIVSPTFSPKRRGHAGGGGASGETTRLKQDEALALRPRLVEERQRRARGLAGARRRDEHSAGMRCERRPQRRQHVVDGKRSGERRQLRVLGEALGDWARLFDNSRRVFKAPGGLSFRLRLGDKRIDPVVADPGLRR